MIAVQEAKRIIEANTMINRSRQVPIAEAYAYRLAEDVYASQHIPGYLQSAMDGYAIRYEKNRISYSVKGEVPAGFTGSFTLSAGNAARIFTGAPIPEGADTVVIQEKVVRNKDTIILEDPQLTLGRNIRPIGSEIKKGELALPSGTKLTAAAIGFLAAIGRAEVAIFPPPCIALILTGNELRAPGSHLSHGQVFECNSFMLGSALKWAGITRFQVYRAQDDLSNLTDLFAAALQHNDCLILTGGVSVGAYDFVVRAAARCGVTQQFHKVKQKPGKPLFFGTKEGKLIFGLPGNPSPVLSCFYQFVLPAVNKMLGNGFVGLPVRQAYLVNDFAKAPGLTNFIRGKFNDLNEVSVLSGQESYKLTAFAKANCIIQFDEEQTFVPAGETVTIYPLPS